MEAKAEVQAPSEATSELNGENSFLSTISLMSAFSLTPVSGVNHPPLIRIYF